MSKFELRDYQQVIIGEARAAMKKGTKNILITAPTGSGKTVLCAHMMRTAALKNMASVFIVHRRELIRQSTYTFSESDVPHGIIAAGFPEDNSLAIQIASIGSFRNRLDRVAPRLIIWDECHHVASKSWASVHEAFPNSFHIGLTATPQRLDGKGLGKWFDQMILGPSVNSLIEAKRLSRYRLITSPGPSDTPVIVGDAVREYLKYSKGKRAILFAPSIAMSERFAQDFSAAGIPSQHVDGTTDGATRDEAIKSFVRGDTLVLMNVDLFGEGFDVPAIHTVIDCAPTESLARAMQRWGRALRPLVGKDCAIISDLAGNFWRHGLPDQDRKWTLDGTGIVKEKENQGPGVRVCLQCFAAQYSIASNCAFCGFVFPIVGRKVEELDGELEEIDIEAQRRLQRAQQAGAQTLEDLVAVGTARGMKNPRGWARHVIAAREAKKAGGRG